MKTTRRTFLGGIAAASIPAGAVAASVAVPAAQTAQERLEYHLAEMKAAAQELDPRIGSWQITRAEDDSLGCSLIITAFRLTGRYDGDGIYEKGSPSWNGARAKYEVRLIKGRPNGERLFKVESIGGMDRMQLPESRLETFIGKRIA